MKKILNALSMLSLIGVLLAVVVLSVLEIMRWREGRDSGAQRKSKED